MYEKEQLFQKRFDDLEEQIKTLKNNNQQLSDKIKTLEDEIITLKDENKQLKEENRKMRDGITTLKHLNRPTNEIIPKKEMNERTHFSFKETPEETEKVEEIEYYNRVIEKEFKNDDLYTPDNEEDEDEEY